jgi:hypothetical protein
MPLFLQIFSDAGHTTAGLVDEDNLLVDVN